MLGGAVDGRCLDVEPDRALGVVEPIEPRARGLGEQLDLARRIDRAVVAARGRGEAGRVAIMMAAAIGELAQLLLGDARLGRDREQRAVVIHRGGQIVELGEPRAGFFAQVARVAADRSG